MGPLLVPWLVLGLAQVWVHELVQLMALGLVLQMVL